MYIGLQVKYP